ncbi:unnamed protein product [Rhizoctonia solani]|uniref:Uncharacterized protein n=1 Tax=Rhizoctonia solani TaxID=456999 RepID=A0A8H3BN10_9AGAM|nr:unnamed protein product [Rhizoctonia solani]
MALTLSRKWQSTGQTGREDLRETLGLGSNDARMQSAPAILNFPNHSRVTVMCSTRIALCAATRALTIPEVATLIFSSGSLSRSDLANLCQVSHYMSEIGTPLLWKNAAAEDLLGLLGSADFYWRRNGNLDSIVLDAYTVDHETFEKFHSYAPYVQALEIYDENSARCYTVEGWNILRAEMEARGRPLLPNLKVLRFLNTSPSLELVEVEWITTFATDGLEEVHIVPNERSPLGQIPFPIASTILKIIVNRCSGVQIITLPANDDAYPDSTGNTRSLAELPHQPTRPWYQELQCLTQLRNLTISEGWLYPVSFQILGSLPKLKSLTIVPGPLDNFDYMFEMNPTLLDGSFPSLIKLSIIGLEDWGVGAILELQGMLRQVTMMKLDFYFDGLEGDTNSEYCGVERIFKGIRNAPCLRELHVCFPFWEREGERPANVYDSMENMGPHPSLEFIYLDGIRINKEFRRTCHSIRELAPIWPNLINLSMSSQQASIRELKDFATLPSLVHLTVKLNLKYPYLPEESGLNGAPLKLLTSSGPVRLSTVYKDLMLSANALLLLWPSLERVTWSDRDPGRMQLAEFFNSEVLRFTKEFLFGTPKEAQLSATKSAKEMKVIFKLIREDLEEVDSDSDSESEDEEGFENL